MPKVMIPPPYRGPTHGVGEVEVAGPTVAECLDQVEADYPGFKAQVVDENGAIHRFIKLFQNGDQLDNPTALDHRLAPADELEVFSAIAGG